jgi:CRP/FNR family transcriptional regulator
MKHVQADLTARVETLRRNIYFDGLPEDLLSQIAGQMSLREYERGDVLFWEGDPCGGLHIIEQGSVKLYRLSPQGRQYIVRILEEGDTCNEVPTFDGGTNPVNVEALEPTRVWVINAEMLRELVQTRPEFAHKVLQNFAANLRTLVRMVSEMAFYQVTSQLARLIDEAENINRGRPQWTQEQLAARLGTVREVLARSLRELERSGAIRMEERQIMVADRKTLEEWTQPYN